MKKQPSGVRRITITAILPLLVAAAFAGPAHTAVTTSSSDALNRMSNGASTGARTTVQDGDFAVFAWVRASTPGGATMANESAFLEVANGLQVHVLGGANPGVRARIIGGGATALEAAAHSRLKPNEWMLLAISFNAAAGRVDVWTISESQPVAHASHVAPGFVIAPNVGAVAIGSFDGKPALLGIYGLTAFRNHTIEQQDVIDVWHSRRHYAPYDLNNLASGGSMNGTDGCIYMFNHAMTTKPINHSGGTQHDVAAVVGEPSNKWNFHIYDILGSGSPSSLRVVRLLSVAEGFVHCSPYDPPGDGFFVKPLPTFVDPLPEPHYVAGEAPLLRQLATGPKGQLRVMTSANSRAVQASDSSAFGSANYAHGFIARNEGKVAGVLNSPARLTNDAPWFGFDTAEHAPYVVGNITPIAPRNFSRFWSGSFTGSSKGPGPGVHLSPGSTYVMRCRPQDLVTADQPLVLETYVLRFPGASDVTWTPNLHSRQGEPGIDVGPANTLSLNTEIWSHTLGPEDSVPTASKIVLAGNHLSKIAINDAVQTGPCISLIQSVTYDLGSNQTTIDVERPLTTVPQIGDVLRFGPWAYEVIEYEWPGVDPESQYVWRGLRLSATQGGGGQGVVVFAHSAWRPHVTGYIFGTAGWSGNGYWRQLDRAFNAGIEPWMQILAPDVWLQMFAQQGSAPSTINEYKKRIRNALSGIEIAWMGDCAHDEGGVSEAWQHYILANAKAQDVIAMTLVMDDRIGSFNATYDDGLRSDLNHLSARGNKRLAEVWTDMLLDAAVDSSAPQIPGDLTGNGSVGVPDLLILLSAWGPCADCKDCPADLNDDCNVGVPDLLILLAHWG